MSSLLIPFVDRVISIGFLYSPAISRYFISKWFFLDRLEWFCIIEASIMGFIAFISLGGILGSDIDIPVFAVIYPIFLFAYNLIFYIRFSNFNKVLAISTIIVFILNATHEVNLFVHDIIFGTWNPDNLLLGIIPMNPFMHVYTIIAGIWMVQLTRIKITKYFILLLSIILLLPFIPFYSINNIWESGTIHHIIISIFQFIIFAMLIIQCSKLKIRRQLKNDVS